MTKPLVSVLMISFNNVQYLKQAIDSVINQTYSNWELIVSDDGSTDGAWELAQALAKKDKRIKTYRNEKNLGIPKNRKQAFDKSTGELIAHLDCDDVLFKYAIETMLEHFDQNPDAMLAQSDSVLIDSKNNVIQYVFSPYPDANLTNFGWRHFGMYRRKGYDTLKGYNTALKSACEDGDLFMQFAEKYPFIKVPAVLYKHRWHDKNTSESNNKCVECKDRDKCNFIRVWAKHANIDHLTFKPLERINESNT